MAVHVTPATTSGASIPSQISAATRPPTATLATAADNILPPIINHTGFTSSYFYFVLLTSYFLLLTSKDRLRQVVEPDNQPYQKAAKKKPRARPTPAIQRVA